MNESVVQGLVTALQNAINIDTMMSNVTTLITFIGGIAVFAFIYRVVRKSVKGASHGKSNM